MNEQLEQFARLRIKQGLEQLPEHCRLLFKKAYSPYLESEYAGDLADNVHSINVNKPGNTLAPNL